MKHTITFIIALIISACGTGGYSPAPIDECIGTWGTGCWDEATHTCTCAETGTDSGSSGGGGADSSSSDGGPACELHTYRCNMKQIGVYGSSAESPIRSINPQAGDYGENQTYACLEVDVIFPESPLNSGALEQQCLDACYDETVSLITSGGKAPSLFYLSNLPSNLPNPACVFADVEDLSDLDGYPSSGSAVCAGQATTRIVDQGPVIDAQCFVELEADCATWDPPVYITHTWSGTAHTINFDSEFRDKLMSPEGWGPLYACSADRYQRIISGGVESWKIDFTSSGELFHTMGLRNGDKDFTVAHGTTGTQYALNSLDALAAAFEQMQGDNTLVLRWKRQNVTGAWVSHTAALNFI